MGTAVMGCEGSNVGSCLSSVDRLPRQLDSKKIPKDTPYSLIPYVLSLVMPSDD